jgi:hypothetical protein|tara:strand:- start:1402 stop:1890 length:489 start_codon:yes stop_codon:yes gene_type:complete
MPIFPGPVSHNNANAPILDATGNQIKGFGFFDDTTARDNLSTNLQVVGFLAIVGTSSPTAFVYNGGGWTNAANWSSVGSGLENVVEDTTPQLGGNLDVYDGSTAHIITTTESDGHIQFTPNGTGRVKLNGTVEFKQFSTPPAAFDGGMYADDNDNLYFGVSS